jgi:predicted RNase H-like HicB family nuclease
MLLPTVVEEYVIAALKHAVAETDEDGVVGAYVPEIPGVLAFGADVHECARNLYIRLEEWVRRALAEGWDVPVLDDLDLGSNREAILAGYRADADSQKTSANFFENETALEEAFRHLDEVAALQRHGAA